MKMCNQCGETKPYDQFHKAARNADGYRHQCKACRSEKGSERRKAYNDKYVKDHYHDVREANREWVKNNRAKHVVSTMAWAARNPDRLKLYQQRWYQRHREEILAKRRERNAAKRNGTGGTWDIIR